jgi:hypothetical protein
VLSCVVPSAARATPASTSELGCAQLATYHQLDMARQAAMVLDVATAVAGLPGLEPRGFDAALGAANKAARDDPPSELRTPSDPGNSLLAPSGLDPKTPPMLPWAQPTRQLAMLGAASSGHHPICAPACRIIQVSIRRRLQSLPWAQPTRQLAMSSRDQSLWPPPPSKPPPSCDPPAPSKPPPPCDPPPPSKPPPPCGLPSSSACPG